jgi:hypothetical protein
MVLVYKTTVQNAPDADMLTRCILSEFPSCKINFDLEDCDRVFRIESKNGNIDTERLIRIFHDQNHHLESLPL